MLYTKSISSESWKPSRIGVNFDFLEIIPNGDKTARQFKEFAKMHGIELYNDKFGFTLPEQLVSEYEKIHKQQFSSEFFTVADIKKSNPHIKTVKLNIPRIPV
jgi:hypothetical protein